MHFKPGPLSLNVYPELRCFEKSGITGAELWRTSMPFIRRVWMVMATTIGLGAYGTMTNQTRVTITMGCLLLFFLALGLYRTRSAVRDELRKLLNARGVHPCRGCAYDMAGLATTICPECGTDSQPAP